MDWIENLNQAVNYIEKNLTEDIDYNEISRITVCPVSLFQRFFVLATGISVSEYIRRRRLSRAAEDLQKPGTKVLDIAMRYRYESPDAFGVAFKRLYGITPSLAKKTPLKRYDRIYFTLTVTHIKGDADMILVNIDKYRYYDPLFEGVRIILSYLGERYSPEYLLGISGSVFKIAGGCPSRPTCVCDFWPPDFFRYLGYEVREYPCVDEDGNDKTDEMIEAVKKHIDSGKPALVWHAFTPEEWDVVCGYDNEAKQFIGRGTHKGLDDYHRESWDRAKTSNVHGFGAILVYNKITEMDEMEAELNSLKNAVAHSRKKLAEGQQYFEAEGIEFYHQWAEGYTKEGRERGVADAYCYDTYLSVRKAAVKYLRELAVKYYSTRDNFEYAAASFQREVDELERARPYLSWDSPWGIDENRSKHLAPILKAAADYYEKAMEYLEKVLLAQQNNECAEFLMQTSKPPEIKTIENDVKKFLKGERLKNALDFIDYLNMSDCPATESWVDGSVSVWHAYYKDEHVCVIVLTNTEQHPEQWTVMSGDYEIYEHEDIHADEDFKQFCLDNVNKCNNCPCGGNMNVTRNLFGNVIEKLCHCSLAFLNPNARALEHVKKWVEMRRLNINKEK